MMMKQTVYVSGAIVLALALSSCSMLGGGKKTASSIQYSPRVPITASPTGVRAPSQMIVDVTYTTPVLDNLRIAVRPRGNELEVYKGARWANTPAEMLATSVLQQLEQMQAFAAVGRSGSGLNPDVRLGLEVRNFESIYTSQGQPDATIVVVAKVVRSGDEKLIRSREFKATTPIGSTDMTTVVESFAQSLGQVSGEIAQWAASAGR